MALGSFCFHKLRNICSKEVSFYSPLISLLGRKCWLLEERWKACSICDDAEENRSDKKQVYCAIKRNKNSARTFRLPRPARAFPISSLLQSVSANERGEMTN